MGYLKKLGHEENELNRLFQKDEESSLRRLLCNLAKILYSRSCILEKQIKSAHISSFAVRMNESENEAEILIISQSRVLILKFGLLSSTGQITGRLY